MLGRLRRPRYGAPEIVTGVGPTLRGRNGGGDRYLTDGEVAVGVLTTGDSPGKQEAALLPSPTPVVLKNQFWAWVRPALSER